MKDNRDGPREDRMDKDELANGERYELKMASSNGKKGSRRLVVKMEHSLTSSGRPFSNLTGLTFEWLTETGRSMEEWLNPRELMNSTRGVLHGGMSSSRLGASGWLHGQPCPNRFGAMDLSAMPKIDSLSAVSFVGL